MNVMNDIAEARASAFSLRASAKACAAEQGALKSSLTRAADSLDAMVLLAVRGIERVEQLEQMLTVVPMLEQRLRDAVDHQHAAYEGAGAVDSADLQAWFADWREDATTALHALAQARGQAGAS